MRAFDLEDAHVGHVEKARGLAHCPMLCAHRGVPGWHLPPGEGDHLRPQDLVGLVERGVLDGGLLFLPFPLGFVRRRREHFQVCKPDEVGFAQVEVLRMMAEQFRGGRATFAPCPPLRRLASR